MRPINQVIIVDDDEIVRFLGQKIIEKTNLVNHIKLFSNGLEAINFLKTNSKHPNLLPEIILLDLNMPIMSGFQFLEEFMKFEPPFEKKINIYIVSSSVSIEEINKIKSMGAVSGFISKPLTIENFEEIVKTLIEKSIN
jgi:CheY-like chemotaxis protein